MENKVNVILQSILFLSETMGTKYLSSHHLLNALFLADMTHLEEFGATITGDNYYCTTDGPIGLQAFAILCLKHQIIPIEGGPSRYWPDQPNYLLPQHHLHLENAVECLHELGKFNPGVITHQDMLNEAKGEQNLG